MLEKLTILDLLRVFGWGVLGAAPIFFSGFIYQEWNTKSVGTENSDAGIFFSILLVLITQIAFGLAAFSAGGK
jgi:hypothetical protein